MNYHANEFPYKTQTMSTPLKTKTGKTRLDRYGQPLTSIRVKQTPADKQRMIDRMLLLYQIYKSDPDIFPVQKQQYGVDPTAFSTERVFEDLADQIPLWQARPNNDVFESFIIRHNAMVDYVKKLADIEDNSGSLSAQYELKFGIRQTRTKGKVGKKVKTNFDDLFSPKS